MKTRIIIYSALVVLLALGVLKWRAISLEPQPVADGAEAMFDGPGNHAEQFGSYNRLMTKTPPHSDRVTDDQAWIDAHLARHRAETNK